jgi:hypothetical protein
MMYYITSFVASRGPAEETLNGSCCGGDPSRKIEETLNGSCCGGDPSRKISVLRKISENEGALKKITLDDF